MGKQHEAFTPPDHPAELTAKAAGPWGLEVCRRFSDRSRPTERTRPETLQRLEQAIGEIHDSESFRRYLDMQARFHRYSPNNVALILSARPDATRVAGYNAWLKMHRYLKKGEHGIKILVPMTRKVENEESGEEEKGLFFGVRGVFAYEQTAGPSA